MSMNPAIFLDRDGVIIENRPNYVLSWSDVLIYPQAINALVKASSTTYKFVIITNQSAIGRGRISLHNAEKINKRLIHFIRKAGGRIDGAFMCPHSPQDSCSCRKPLPGLIYQAIDKLDIDISRSYMIGDALTDLLAGQAAGISELILVRTGRGFTQEKSNIPRLVKPFKTYDNLFTAFCDIFSFNTKKNSKGSSSVQKCE